MAGWLEHQLLSPEALVRFPAPTRWLTATYNSSPGGSAPSSGLLGNCSHVQEGRKGCRAELSGRSTFCLGRLGLGHQDRLSLQPQRVPRPHLGGSGPTGHRRTNALGRKGCGHFQMEIGAHVPGHEVPVGRGLGQTPLALSGCTQEGRSTWMRQPDPASQARGRGRDALPSSGRGERPCLKKGNACVLRARGVSRACVGSAGPAPPRPRSPD